MSCHLQHGAPAHWLWRHVQHLCAFFWVHLKNCQALRSIKVDSMTCNVCNLGGSKIAPSQIILGSGDFTILAEIISINLQWWFLEIYHASRFCYTSLPLTSRLDMADFVAMSSYKTHTRAKAPKIVRALISIVQYTVICKNQIENTTYYIFVLGSGELRCLLRRASHL